MLGRCHRKIQRLRLKIPKISRRKMNSIVRLNPPEKYNIKTGPEITLYLKGFIAKTKTVNDFDNWIKSHKRIKKKQGWNELAKGWNWDCGKAEYPMPLMTGAHLFYTLYRNTRFLRLNPVMLATSVAFDASFFAAKLATQYHYAEKNTTELAEKLAKDLDILSNKYKKVRVVSHSLGSELLLNAVDSLPSESRPDYIHMCAPSFAEDEYKHILGEASRQKTFIYYTDSDIVLSVILRMIKNKEPVGAFGLNGYYENVKTVDVTEHFSDYFLTHSAYSEQFYKFAKEEEPNPTIYVPSSNVPKYQPLE